MKSLIDQYNSTATQFEGIRRNFGLSHLRVNCVESPSLLTIQNKIEAILNKIEIECEGAIGVIESIPAKLPKEDLDKLIHLRKELAEFSAELSNIYFEKNIEEAIKECEQAHFLASALISSRVIEYIMAKIEGKSTEEKIEVLVEKGIIDNKRKDVREVVIKASRTARNFLSHDVKVTPSPSDALSLLSDAIRILKLYHQLNSSSQT